MCTVLKPFQMKDLDYFLQIKAAQSTWGFNNEDRVGYNVLYNTAPKWELMEVVGNLAHIES